MKHISIIVFLAISAVLALGSDAPNIYNYTDSQGRMTDKQVRDYLLDYFAADAGLSAHQLVTLDQDTRDKMNSFVEFKMLTFQSQHLADANGFYHVERIFADVNNRPLPPKPDPKPPTPSLTPAEQMAVYSQPEPLLYVRKSSSLLDTNFTVTKGAVSSEQKADGALVSYNRNLSADKNTWTAQGVVEAPVRFPADHSSNTLQEAWYVPAIEFNKLGGNGVAKTKKLDNLTLLNGTYLVTQFDDVGTSTIRASQLTESDFNFKSLIVGGEAEYEPTNTLVHLGTYENLFLDDKSGLEWISVMQRLVLHLDGGKVLDSGGKSALHEGQVYTRFGPVYSFTIFPGAQMDLPAALASASKLEFQYGHYLGLYGKAYDDYQINLNISLDKSGIFGLGVSYEHGGLNANGDKADQVTAGLTIKE